MRNRIGKALSCWITYAILVGSLIAAGQLWLVSAILSRPLPSGRTGWERLAEATERKRKPEPTEKLTMPIIDFLGITYRCGNSIIPHDYDERPQATVRLRINSGSPGVDPGDGPKYLYFSIWSETEVTFEYESIIEEPFPQEINVEVYANRYATFSAPIRITAYGWNDSTGWYVAEDYYTPYDLVLDLITLPTFAPFISYECNPDGTGVAEWYVTAKVDNQPTSWSYELYSGPDATGNRIYAGSVNSAPSPPECSPTMSVTGIPGGAIDGTTYAKSIKLIATNANGTANTVVNLVASNPDPLGLSISANPTNILEGQEVTLHWTVGINTSSAEIDNGVGLVYSISDPSLNEPSGSVTVSPTETTTYTITARGGCDEITASVTIVVTPLPRYPTGSKVAAVFDIVEDYRTTAGNSIAGLFDVLEEYRTVAGNSVAALFDIRAAGSARFVAVFDCIKEVRSTAGHSVPALFDIRGLQSSVVAACYHVLTADLYRLIAYSTDTGARQELGKLDPLADPLTLTDVALAPGTYELWVERDGLFWRHARNGHTTLITLSDAPEEEDLGGLPYVTEITSSIISGITYINWTSTLTRRADLIWGIWYGTTSPVSIAGAPNAVIPIYPEATAYKTGKLQTDSEYVAIAAIDPDWVRGQKAELFLAWDTEAPATPPNQTATPY